MVNATKVGLHPVRFSCSHRPVNFHFLIQFYSWNMPIQRRSPLLAALIVYSVDYYIHSIGVVLVTYSTNMYVHILHNSCSSVLRHLDSTSEPGLTLGGYFCPQCKAKYSELPVECKVCREYIDTFIYCAKI